MQDTHVFPTFIFYQEYLLWKNGLKAFLFSRDKTYSLFGLSALTSVRAIMKPFSFKTAQKYTNYTTNF